MHRLSHHASWKTLPLLAALALLLAAGCGGGGGEPADGDGPSSGAQAGAGDDAAGGAGNAPSSPEEMQQRLSQGEQEILGPVVIGEGDDVTEFGLSGRGQGLGVPADFPEDIPLLHEAEITMAHRRGGQLMLGYTVGLPRSAAVEALQTELRDAGWWIEGRREGDGVNAFTAVHSEDQERTAKFSIGEHDRGQASLVMVSTEPAPAS
jgi:hypothetical protein